MMAEKGLLSETFGTAAWPKKYFGQMIAWLLIALLEIPFYILMVFCFENLSSQGHAGLLSS